MDAVEFRQLLESLPDGKGSAAIDFHLSQIESEKTRGITEVSKRNKENESLRRFKIAFENLGYDGQGDLTEFVTSLKTTTETAGQKDITLGDLQGQLKKLQGDFSKTQAELMTERQAAQELKAKAKRETIRATLIDSLKDKVYAHDFLANDLIGSGRVDLDEAGKVVFVNEDKTTVSYDEGVKKLLESRPDIVKNAQRPGVASQPTGGTSSSPQSDDTARLERLRKLSSGGII